MTKTKLSKLEKRAKYRAEVKKNWQELKKQCGSLDDFGKKSTNAGFAVLKGLFTFMFAVTLLAVVIASIFG
jgi:hypothetical protein